MNFSGTRCDECGRVKGDVNHWHQMGVSKIVDAVSVELTSIGMGLLGPNPQRLDDAYQIHDLCGEACLYKHLCKLLKINPVVADES